MTLTINKSQQIIGARSLVPLVYQHSKMYRKGKVMGLQRTTKDAVERGVSRRENFRRGNLSGKWEDKNYFRYRSGMGQLDKGYADVLEEHSKQGELFVLYSYATPMAWYRLNDSDANSNGDGKWYYVDEKYSSSTTQHQRAYRSSLMGANVVTLAYVGGEVTEDEKEYY